MTNEIPSYETNIGAAILGMYAAVKICRNNSIDPHVMCDLLERFLDNPDKTLAECDKRKNKRKSKTRKPKGTS